MNRCINLDSSFTPISYPEIEFKQFKFSGGEIHIKLNNHIDYSLINKVIITNRIKSSDDIMSILLVHDALKRKGIKSFDLVIPYVPYARQDQVHANGEALSIKVFANLINGCEFEKVYIFDAHSAVTPALINNSENLLNDYYVEEAIKEIKKHDTNSLVLVSPDSGANKKINKLYDKVKETVDGVVKCDKKRDTSNGQLSGFEVFTTDLTGKSCLIVDDICDGGRTFVGIADELKKLNADKIYLFVSHGIFSNGFETLTSVFETIYTTNSYNDVVNEKLIKFKLNV